MNPTQTFDRIGNSPSCWLECAFDLLVACGEVRAASRRASKKHGLPFTRSVFPHLMLRAFAMECLVKARFLKEQRSPLCVGGEYEGINSRDEKHRLDTMVAATTLSVSPEEVRVLKVLSAIAVGVGRYPVFKRFDHLQRFGVPKGLRVQWDLRTDDAVFLALTQRLLEPFALEPWHRRVLKGA